MVALFFPTSTTVPHQGIILFFFAHFLNKFVKPKCEAPFIKLFKGYI